MKGLRSYMASVILFAFAISGIILFIGAITDTYGGSADTSDLEAASTQAQKQANNTVIKARSKLGTSQGGGLLQDIAAEVFVVQAIAGTILLVFETIALVPSLASTMLSEVPVPSWVIGMISAIVMIGVVLEIVSLYRGLRT